MFKNVGNTDRLTRLILGLGLAGAAFFAKGDWRWIAVPGAVLIVTAFVRFCPAYWLAGIRTMAQPTTTRG